MESNLLCSIITKAATIISNSISEIRYRVLPTKWVEKSLDVASQERLCLMSAYRLLVNSRILLDKSPHTHIHCPNSIAFAVSPEYGGLNCHHLKVAHI